ncbi:MAG: carbonic anhydrase [Lachnospiraceae bacterium]|nr:carbonic anhydrase [Lachnospiraceae bacterium]
MDKDEAMLRLIRGNEEYQGSRSAIGDISPAVRLKTARCGQTPFAVIITCSDSRVIPEAIFNCGIGDLFVIRVAGNVIDNHQLGSIEYAADHLGTNLVVVLGHTCCGAVDAAINHDPEGYIKFITDEIQAAIGAERDPYKAGCLNVKRSIALIESSVSIRKDEAKGLSVVGAMYDIETGKVEFLKD